MAMWNIVSPESEHVLATIYYYWIEIENKSLSSRLISHVNDLYRRFESVFMTLFYTGHAGQGLWALSSMGPKVPVRSESDNTVEKYFTKFI